MLARIRRSIEKGDEGFTLIELLVVIIIIGILAAIAIPVFLNQRKKGWDAAAKADLRNAATAQESYLVDNGTYTHLMPDLIAAGFKQTPGVITQSAWMYTSAVDGGTTYTNTAYAAGAYCILALSKSGTYFWYSSRGGGLVNSWTACLV